MGEDASWAVCVEPRNVGKTYSILNDSGILNTEVEIKQISPDLVAIPITDVEKAKELNFSPLQLDLRFRKQLDPHNRLKKIITDYLSEIEAELLLDIPNTWQKVGDMAIFPRGSFSNGWDELIMRAGEGFWAEVAEAIFVVKIGIGNYIDSGPMRQSRVQLMCGDDGWVSHKEHGVNYVFDATKVMFSQGNLNERGRMGRIAKQNATKDVSRIVGSETIVDLFNGIGYYSLQYLVHGNIEHLHACEMNPDSITAFKRGLEKNGVADKCTIHQGNNQRTAPQLTGKADRVLLGLLPTSTAAWPLAVNCLKEEGGVIHVHENIEEYEEGAKQKWLEETVEKFNQLAKSIGRNWQITPQPLQLIKWYAPSVRHVVLDLHFSSTN
jgi:tRNA wybutosine-synthesizing protein 3